MQSHVKRRIIVFGGAAVVAAGFGALNATKAPAGFEERVMTVAQMKDTGGLIVDIRTPEEWADTGVIDGAMLVTFESPDSFMAQVGPEISDGRDLILICRSGNRTRRAAEMLAGTIPNQIISIQGGMSAQIKSGYQTVSVE
ncbi:rhodanese-like domain-containing protein [Celeribacter litoreus]|uniref:rhodanese-like domain-containing protein n=1 Tax=Celeribacter litoreus TaxID=2876714 RepID=UPI001CCA3FFD|nr:rhodanese-like domain-containing protein [Celeribacter litoreus]MCA0042769.1 rhodanese-like domain-containing protein [Celeribacter litoreus]